MSLVGVEILTKTIQPTSGVGANRFVGYDGNLTGLNARAFGVSRATFAAGDVGDAIVLGTAYITLAATLAAGATVTSDAAGAAIAAGGNPVNGRLIVGGVSGDIVEMLVNVL